MEYTAQEIALPTVLEVPAAGGAERRTTLSALLIAVFILAAVFLKSEVYIQLPINADEFYYLDLVHAYQRGEVSMPVQTFHVHFFSWLTGTSDNEVAQALRARGVMGFLFFGTCALLFLLGRHLIGVPGAAFSVLCYLSTTFTIGNGAAFRSDASAAFLSLAAVYLLVVHGQRWVASLLAGAAMALACLFTIKAGLYLGLLILLMAIRVRTTPGRRVGLTSLVWFWAAFLLVGGTSYLLHRASLSQVSAATGAAHVRGAFGIFFSLSHLFQGRNFFFKTLTGDMIVWLFVGLGLCVSLVDTLGRRRPLPGRIAYVPIMFLPLLSIVFYRNTFPYYYVFMMPPVMLLAGYAFERLVSTLAQTDGRLATAVTVVLAVAVFVPHLVLDYPVLRKLPLKTAVQHDLLDEVHKMFPEPVPYLDAAHVIGSFPSVASFMGSVSIERYMRAGQPMLERRLAEEKPVFLLVDMPYLNPQPAQRPVGPEQLTLLDEDWQALKSYFIPHWGPIWVAGRRFDLGSDWGPRVFGMTVPGTYTVETDGDVKIDGTVYHDGDTVQLDDQAHLIEPVGPVEQATLRWGDHLYRPTEPPPLPALCLLD